MALYASFNKRKQFASACLCVLKVRGNYYHILSFYFSLVGFSEPTILMCVFVF